MSDIPFNPLIVFPFISLGGTLGVLVAVACLGSALYGITTVQTFIYHQHRERDPITLRYSVYLLWIIDTFQFICMLHITYFYCVKNFGNIFGLNDIPWTWPAFTFTSVLNGLLVTGWYAHRLWKLSRNIWVILVIGTAAVLTFVGGIALSVLTVENPTILAYVQIAQWPWYLWVSSQIVSDVTITVSLTVSLLRRKTGFSRTGSIINLIIMYSLSTCLITRCVKFEYSGPMFLPCSCRMNPSATNIAMLVTGNVVPGRFYHVGLAVLSPKLTLNSLLAMLNTRNFLRSKIYHDNSEPVSIHLSRLPDSSAEARSDPQSQSGGESMQLGIHIEKSVTQA
ncbi:hypothetical protein BDW22DRAFT_436024 [Trametopsis cervina]|nr:hypothetical protein BDW22DRAFT_436024 [Trametopsis cervina]